MKLILSIVTCPPGCNMEGQHHQFGIDGGSFGRSADNQWVLPDPSRYVSSCHGQICFENGQFVLVDVSTNGIYLNDGAQPLGSGNRSILSQADQLQFGDYRIQINIDASENVSPAAHSPAGLSPTEQVVTPAEVKPSIDDLDKWLEPAAPVDTPSPVSPPPISNTPAFESQGIGIDLGLKGEEKDPLAALGVENPSQPDLLQSPKGVGLSDLVQQTPSIDQQMMKVPGVIPDDWDDLLGGSVDAAEPSPLARSEDSEATTFKPIESNSRALRELSGSQNTAGSEAAQAPEIQPQLTVSDSMGLEELLTTPTESIAPPKQEPLNSIPNSSTPTDNVSTPQLAGIEVTGSLAEALGLLQLSAEQKQLLNNAVADTVRETVAGMMKTLRARSEIKSELRMNMTTIQSAENNPLKFSVTPDDAIENMFAKTGKAYLSPVESIKDGFADIADHQLALFDAMRAAYDNLLKQFDPSALEQKYERTRGKGLLKSSGKGKNWDSFKATYEEYSEDNEATFKRLFGDVFADSYERKMHSLKMNRNKM